MEAAIADYKGEKIDHVDEDEGKLVCKCFGITEGKIRSVALENNLRTVEDVTNYTKAGGACGTCIPEIEDILTDLWKNEAKINYRERKKKMEEARASWNTVYHSREGFECQVTLRDDDEASLTARTSKVMSDITGSGGIALRRRGYVPAENNHHHEVNGESTEDRPEKTYVDADGARRCNLRLRNGNVCSSPVTEREGRYGLFWSCPNYKEHTA